MPEPNDKELDEYLAGQGEVSRLYKEAPMESPSAGLDEKIMLAARRELRPGYQRWMLPLSAAAVTLFAVSIMLRMQHESISPVPQEKMAVAPEAPPPATAAPAMTADHAAVAKERQAPASVPPAAGEMKSEKRRQESPALRDAAPQPLPSAGAAPAAPVPQGELQGQDQSQSYNVAPSESEEGDSEGVESRPGATAEPRRSVVTDSAARKAEKPAADEQSPEAWIQRIRQLRAEGKADEAAAQIKSFRQRYPDYQLPEDLKWAD